MLLSTLPRTPETLKLRGLGRPWETGERLSWQCGPIDAAELEEARRLCFFVGHDAMVFVFFGGKCEFLFVLDKL